MRIKPNGGVGDELMMTAIVREYKRAFPAEEIHLTDNVRMDIWKGCPWIGWGTTNNGKEISPNTYAWSGANTAHGFARALGFELVDETPEVWLTKEEREQDFGIKNWERTVAIDIEARWRSRQWRPDLFVRTVELLRDDGWTVIEIGQRDDGSFRDVLETKLLPDISFLNKLKLREAFTLLSKVSLFIGNDSGCFHMAAAVGTPQIALFGPIKWHARAYWNTTPLFAYSDCGPHCMMTCTRQEKPPYGEIKHCMNEIRPERVAEAARVAYHRFVESGLRLTRPRPGRSRPMVPVGEPPVEW